MVRANKGNRQRSPWRAVVREERRLGISATRKGMTEEQLRVLRHIMGQGMFDWLHHGDGPPAKTSGDSQAHKLARRLGLKIHTHPMVGVKLHNHANVREKPKKPITRNHDIVKAVDEMTLCPSSTKEELRGSGTWATIRYCRKVGKPATIIWPDGSRTHLNKQ